MGNAPIPIVLAPAPTQTLAAQPNRLDVIALPQLQPLLLQLAEVHVIGLGYQMIQFLAVVPSIGR